MLYYILEKPQPFVRRLRPVTEGRLRRAGTSRSKHSLVVQPSSVPRDVAGERFEHIEVCGVER
jgi:hypothetical protein